MTTFAFAAPAAGRIIVATFASLLVALTVTPALCRLLLAKVGATTHGDGFLVRWLKRRYEPTLAFALQHGRAVLAAAALATIASLSLGRTFGTSFLPEFHEGTFTVFL
ncbi:MAG TPA: efflux RND transporter permease subunit, partial [Plasticicumulans sp.]|nr:efflux RND transporter permease subunit [Plasticicumulans sp.]